MRGLSTKIILGYDFLQKYDADLNFRLSTLYLKNGVKTISFRIPRCQIATATGLSKFDVCNVSLSRLSNLEENGNLKLNKEIIIKPNEKIKIFNLNENESYSPNKKILNNMCIAYEKSENNLFLINVSGNAKRLKPRTILCKIGPKQSMETSSTKDLDNSSIKKVKSKFKAKNFKAITIWIVNSNAIIRISLAQDPAY